jgi:hypothetical protein
VLHFYKDLTPDEASARVSLGVRAATARALGLLKKELRLDDLGITWFVSAAPEEKNAWSTLTASAGLARALCPTVRILATLDLEQAIAVLAHEARHIHQWRFLGSPILASSSTPASKAWVERDADEFADDFTSRFFGRSGRREELAALKADFSALEAALG